MRSLPVFRESAYALVFMEKAKLLEFFITEIGCNSAQNFLPLATTEIQEHLITRVTWPTTESSALGSVKQKDIHVLDGFAGSRFELWRTRTHHSIVERVRQLWPESQAGLMEAVVIGEEEFISRPTRVDFQRSGTYHVLVVSGMNVTILALSGFWLLRKLRVGEIAASLLTAGLTISYAALTGLGSPVWRAALMLVVYFAAGSCTGKNR